VGRRIDVMKLICSLGHCECDGPTVHKLSQRRLTACWLAPLESDCSRMRSKVSSDWLPSYIKATRPVLQILKLAGYFPPSPRIRTCIEMPHVQTDSGGPTQPPGQLVLRFLSGVKSTGAWCWPLFLCSIELKSWWSYTATPPICLRGLDKGNFAFVSTGIKMWDIGGLQINAGSLRNFSIGQLDKLPVWHYCFVLFQHSYVFQYTAVPSRVCQMRTFLKEVNMNTHYAFCMLLWRSKNTENSSCILSIS